MTLVHYAHKLVSSGIRKKIATRMKVASKMDEAQLNALGWSWVCDQVKARLKGPLESTTALEDLLSLKREDGKDLSDWVGDIYAAKFQLTTLKISLGDDTWLDLLTRQLTARELASDVVVGKTKIEDIQSAVYAKEDDQLERFKASYIKDKQKNLLVRPSSSSMSSRGDNRGGSGRDR